MGLEEIKKKIIKAAIEDYDNDPKYNILNGDLLEDIILTLEHTKGNKTFSKEQAQALCKDFERIIFLREDFINKIKIAKQKKEADILDVDTIIEMNKAKRELLETTSTSLDDFYKSNSDLEEVSWLKDTTYKEEYILNLLEEEYKKYKNRTIDFETLTIRITSLLDRTILGSKEEEVRTFCKSIYKKEIEKSIEKLQDKAKKYIESVEKEKVDPKEVSNCLNALKESKEKLDKVKIWAKKIDPTFKIDTLFTEEEVNQKPVISWYKEQQSLKEEDIIKANENALKENASLREQAELTIILNTNDQAEMIITEHEKKKEQPKTKKQKTEIKKQVPTDAEYEDLKNKYNEVLTTLNKKIGEYNRANPNLLTLEAAILNEIKIGNYKNVNNFLESNAYLETLEEQIMAMKTELSRMDSKAFRQFKYFISNDITTNIEEMAPCGNKEDVDTFALERKNTIDALKEQYDSCQSEEEKEHLKAIIFAEQTIKARRIMEEQRANLAFNGVSCIKKYENHITFVEGVETKKEETTSKAKVKEFRVRIRETQKNTGKTVFKEVPAVKVSIAENKLNIEYSKQLKEELAAAKYGIDIMKTQIKSEAEVEETSEETEDKTLKSYNLTHMKPSAFNIAIVFRDLTTNKEAKRFILIKDGVITKQVLNDGKVDPKVLGR